MNERTQHTPNPAAAPWTGTLEARVAELLRAGEPAALVTVAASAGSAPRHAGTRALQTGSGFEGTVGGGLLEAKTMAAARRCLEEGRSTRAFFELDESAPDCDQGCMVCGGSMEILCEFLRPEQAGMFAAADETLRRGGRGIWLVELAGDAGAMDGGGAPRPVTPERRLFLAEAADAQPPSGDVTVGLAEAEALLERTKQRPGLIEEAGRRLYVEPLDAPPVLLLCGGGHVALEVARLAHSCGFVVDVADDREEFANHERFPMARHCHVLPGFAWLAAVCGIGRRHYVAIMTRGHAFDREALAQALAGHARYIGMIGSRSKREHVYAILRETGIAEERLATVRCPIGLGIRAETPQQIAVSVVAELLAERAGTLEPLRAGR